MRLWTADRAAGKTTAAILWAATDPERRAIVVATAREKDQIVRQSIRRVVDDPAVAERIRVFSTHDLLTASAPGGETPLAGLEVWVDDPARVLTVWLRDATGATAEHGAVTPTGTLDLPAWMATA